MRLSTLVLLLAPCVILVAQNSDEKDALATVQKLFDGMAAHDPAIIRSTVLPDARFYYTRADAAPASTTAEDFIGHIAALQGGLLERFTRQPGVSIHGRMAQVWGEYEFLRDGKFIHCGVDSVSLFKTTEGWKIAAIAYTAETAGCPNR
jgi:hypothetical protein